MSLADLMALQDQSDLSGVPIGQGINTAGMADRQRNNARSGAPRPVRPPRPIVRRPSSPGVAQPMMEFVDLTPPIDPMSEGRRIAQVTNNAIQDEMDRRVAISREMRRMQVELEKKRMEEETERREIAAKHDALLKRLGGDDGMITVYH